jgi:hypothetical protein
MVQSIRVLASAVAMQINIQPSPNSVGNNETDNNADTCCLGINFVILMETLRYADVYAYDESIAPIQNVPIVTGATAYDCPTTGVTHILIINEGLYYGNKLKHSLFNPNQLRSFGVPYWDNPYDPTHPVAIEASDGLSIPLRGAGTKLLFTSRSPTDDELATCPRIELTSKRPWNPSNLRMSSVETDKSDDQPTTPWKRQIREVYSSRVERTRSLYLDPRSDDAILDSIDPLLVDFGGCRSVGQVHQYDPDTEDIPTRRTFTSTERHARITAEELSDTFGIGIQRARATLTATTQRGTRSAILPLSRRYRADRMFQKRHLNLKISSDTGYFKAKSLHGNIASQIYFHKSGFAACYHVPKVDDERIGPTLPNFIDEYGIPEELTVDGAAVQIGQHTKFMDAIKRNQINYHVSHPRRPNENPAEGGIREIKRRFYRMISKHSIPMRLWDYVLTYVVETMNVTVSQSRYAKGRTPLEIVTGITPDITEYLDFHIYQWVYFKTNAGLGPKEIGRWLGVSHRTGPLMTYWILPKSGIPISCDTVQRVTNSEKETDEVKREMALWTASAIARLEATSANVERGLEDVPQQAIFDLENEDEEFSKQFSQTLEETPLTIDEEDDPHPAEVGTDAYLNMEVGLRRGGEDDLQRARVKRRAVDEEGRPIGRPSNNPLTDTRMYEVEYIDGGSEVLAANILAENILAQVDENGERHLLIDEITDHRKLEDAIPKEEGTFVTTSGATRKVHTTRGWEVYVQWKDGSGNWITMKELKESYPLELAEYAKAKGIIDEPAFVWWAPHAIRKKARIISKVKSKYWERTHKYGIRIPRTMAEAKSIDDANGDTQWVDAIKKEMTNNRIAFEEHEGSIEDLVGFEEITGHLVFDVKLSEGFRRKARFCADGHKTKAPASVTYSSVVSRDSVRIMLLIAALNDLELKAADIQNAFLTAPNREKCWMRAGPEFGHEEGKVFIVRRALYGLKSAGASFRAFLADHFESMGFKPSVADPDVWMRPATKADGEEYYEYLLAYVDDILAISVNPDAIMDQVKARFKLKNDAVETPANYLGAKLALKNLDGKKVWTMSSVEYLTAAIKTLETSLEGTQWKIPTKVSTPMETSYHPELDASPELEEKDHTRYQELIGILRWATEISRVDILHELSILSQYQAAPRTGHMHQLLHIFAYIKKKPKLTMYFDPRLPNLDLSSFKTNREDFKAQYTDAEEEMPHRMPKPRGRPVTSTAFVDASHAANRKTRRSHTGYVIFLNRAPILWLSRKQSTVESSTFSSEFIALRSCIEAIVHLRFKLRMFGIPILDDEPTRIFCDNETVVKNSTMIESTLNKKHNSLAYHYTRWNVAAGICSLAWISGADNISDPFTKKLPEITRERLFGNWLY